MTLTWLPPPAIAWDQVATLLAPLPLVVLANLADRHQEAVVHEQAVDRTDVKRGTTQHASVGFHDSQGGLGAVTWVCLLILALVFALYGLGAAAYGTARSSSGQGGFGLLTAASGIAAGAVLARPVRSWLARALPIDPGSAVHATALVLSILLFGTQVSQQLTADVVARQAAVAAPLTPLDLIAQEIPFLLLALAGVGLFVRRGTGATLDRLGLVVPQPWQVLLALAAAGAFFAFSSGADALAHQLTPQSANEVQNATGRIFGELATPLGIATIAVAAGICEEVFFRGALQPRLGLVWTALLFAAVHSQYGLSIDALAVLTLAICLGLMRRYMNTTSSAVCHVAYNALVGIGVALSGFGLLLIVGAEVLLLAGAAAAWALTHGVATARPDR